MPQSYTFRERHCHPCKFLDTVMIHSGMEPLYHSYCKHPKHESEGGGIFPRGRFIGKRDIQPQWCPLLEVAKAAGRGD